MLSKFNKILQFVKAYKSNLSGTQKIFYYPYNSFAQQQQGGAGVRKDRVQEDHQDANVKEDPINLERNADQSAINMQSQQSQQRQTQQQQQEPQQDQSQGINQQSHAPRETNKVNPSTGGIPEPTTAATGYTGFSARRDLKTPGQVERPKPTILDELPDSHNVNYVGPGRGNPMLKFMEMGQPRFQKVSEDTETFSVDNYMRYMSDSTETQTQGLRQKPTFGIDRHYAAQETQKKIKELIREEEESERPGRVIAKDKFKEVLNAWTNMAASRANRESQQGGGRNVSSEEVKRRKEEEILNFGNEVREFVGRSEEPFEKDLDAVLQGLGIEKEDFKQSALHYAKEDKEIAKQYDDVQKRADETAGGTIDETNLYRVVQKPKQRQADRR